MTAAFGGALILTFDEIRILLYSLGFTSCEGIYMPQKEFTPSEVLKAVHSLERRGLLTAESGKEDCKARDAALDGVSAFGGAEGAADAFAGANDKEPFFVMEPGLLRMMRAVGAPGGMFEYRPGEELPGFSKELYNGPEYFCYALPDYYVVAERDWTRVESVRLRAMDAESFVLWRKEREEEAKEQSIVADVSTDCFDVI